MDILRVKDNNVLTALQNHEDGEMVYCEEEKQCYVWKDKHWNPVDSTINPEGEIKINYNDLMRTAIAGMSPFDEELTNKYINILNAWDGEQQNQYYMLYGRDINYFTVFNKTDYLYCKSLGEEVFNCLSNIGSVIYVEDFDAVEDIRVIFWVKLPDDTITDIYLFDYTEGVVPFV